MNDLKPALNLLCPMHMHVTSDGRIADVGTTLQKLRPGLTFSGQDVQDIFEFTRPRSLRGAYDLLQNVGKPLRLNFRTPPMTRFKGLAAPDGEGGVIIDLSFGISLLEAVGDYTLTSHDFAATDLAVEMLYLIEAKAAAMDGFRNLSKRLQLAHAEAEEQAYTDTLTGLRNRRALEQALNRILASDEPFALAHLDLDFFKQVNDTHGHSAGDRVLQLVAERMRLILRSKDLVARTGGDEFVLLISPPVEQGALAAIAWRLIDAIEEPINTGETVCRVSSSIGICVREPGQVMTMEAVAQLADDALYSAKRNGRGQVAFAPAAPKVAQA